MNVRQLIKVSWTSGLTPVAAVLAETFWVYPWMLWLGKWPALGWQRPLLSMASIVLLALVACFITRLSLKRRWYLRWVQIGITAGGGLAVYLVVWLEYGSGTALFSSDWISRLGQSFLNAFSEPQAIVGSILAGIYLWWRGIALGRSAYQFREIYRLFIIGLIALVLLLLLWGGTLGISDDLTAGVGPYIGGFFFFGLIALALGNFQAISQKMLHSGERSLFNRRWLAVLLAMVAGIIFLGLAVSSIFSVKVTAWLGRALSFAADILLRLVAYVAFLFGLVGQVLYYIVKFFLDLIRRNQPQQQREQNLPPDFSALREQPPLASMPPWAVLILKWVLFTVVTVIIIWLLIKAVSRYRAARNVDDVDETQESLWSWAVFRADLALLWHAIWRKVRPKRKIAVVISELETGTAMTPGGILGVREIYRRLLGQAGSAGYARQRPETPNEYAARLSKAAPDVQEPLVELTNMYVPVRYGECDMPSPQLDRANKLWQVLQDVLQRLKEVLPTNQKK